MLKSTPCNCPEVSFVRTHGERAANRLHGALDLRSSGIAVMAAMSLRGASFRLKPETPNLHPKPLKL